MSIKLWLGGDGALPRPNTISLVSWLRSSRWTPYARSAGTQAEGYPRGPRDDSWQDGVRSIRTMGTAGANFSAWQFPRVMVIVGTRCYVIASQ